MAKQKTLKDPKMAARKSRKPTNPQLIEAALKARNNAYAPYSKFKVGAALLTSTGKIVVGVNVESCSFPVSMCAERTAIGSAIAMGETRFDKIAIVVDTQRLTPPCGMCRQALMEFNPNLKILMANLQGKKKSFSLRDLLPNAFEPKHLMA
jgi:cytidine deaminase